MSAAATLSDTVELKDQLLKATSESDNDRIVDLLKALADVKMTVGLLKDSQIGPAVTPLRKSEDAAVAEAAKGLIKSWKAMAKGGAAPSPAAAPAAKAAKAKAADSASSSSSSAADSSAASSSPPGIARSNTLESDRPTAYSSAELPKMREAVREKMRQVLMTDYDGPPLYDVAEATEAAIEALSRGDSKAYGDKFRQLAFNLKKNAPLRYSVNRQETTPEALVSMAPKDLATQEKKKAMEEMAQFEHDKRSLDWNSKNDHKIREEMGLGKIVGMYSCGRCKSLKIKNSEAQTRSADEPMTQFFTCLDCGNRWRF